MITWSTLASFLAGFVVGQISLVLALALTRGARDREADEHEEGF